MTATPDRSDHGVEAVAFDRSLVAAFDYVWDRFTARLSGLTDDEYRWEPVDGCWTIRRDERGTWVLDGPPAGAAEPDPPPVTTIAWRIGHVGGSALPGFAARLFPDLGPTDGPALPGSVAGVPDFLDASYRWWRAGLAGLTDAALAQPLGPAWGPYSESSVADLALHVLDEVVHHAAEIALLRDLYLHRHSLGGGVSPG
jgi:hypothetical protein